MITAIAGVAIIALGVVSTFAWLAALMVAVLENADDTAEPPVTVWTVLSRWARACVVALGLGRRA